MGKSIRVNWVATLKSRGFFKFCCYTKRRETCAWVAMRWNSDKKDRRVVISRPLVRKRPRHTLVRLECFLDDELEARLYADSLVMAERVGKLWQRETTIRTYRIVDFRFGRRVVESRVPFKVE